MYDEDTILATNIVNYKYVNKAYKVKQKWAYPQQ